MEWAFRQLLRTQTSNAAAVTDSTVRVRKPVLSWQLHFSDTPCKYCNLSSYQTAKSFLILWIPPADEKLISCMEPCWVFKTWMWWPGQIKWSQFYSSQWKNSLSTQIIQSSHNSRNSVVAKFLWTGQYRLWMRMERINPWVKYHHKLGKGDRGKESVWKAWESWNGLMHSNRYEKIWNL